MLVRDAMTPSVLTVGPTHTLRQAARRWRPGTSAPPSCSTRTADGPGILTERDVLMAVAGGQDPEPSWPPTT